MDAKVVRFWIWAAIAMVGSLVAYAEFAPARDQVKVATERCINHKGDGDWRGSSGVPLETFCKLRVTSERLAEQCKVSPETC